ncbi:MAG: VWA domain-containing protein [Lachnospiraceae bacterium]|nr:VWA domain-containing protein [Lachnospiraceae bacterium]
MVLKHPIWLLVGLPLLAILTAAAHLIRRKKGDAYLGGRLAAGTEAVRNLPEYVRRRTTYRILAVVMEVSLLCAAVCTLILLARPYKTETVVSGVKKRDIFLCLDVSYSIYELNYELVDSLEEVVAGLEGDRFGISIFNTSTVLYVPMTDDYDFVISRLESLKDYFRLQGEYMQDFGDYTYLYEIPDEKMDRYYELQEILGDTEAGTLIENYRRGSSLIGEGLAACLYSFPGLDDAADRTRCVIMATDNSEQALTKPLLELEEACALCAKNDVTVYGVFPESTKFDSTNEGDDYDACLRDFKRNVERTGGYFYLAGQETSVSDIVAGIQEREALAVAEITVTRETDQPAVPYILLVVFLAAAGITRVILRR